MTPDDARRILGLTWDDDPRTHLDALKQTRDRIRAVVQSAPNPTLADRHQKHLTEFEEALDIIQDAIDAADATCTTVPRITLLPEVTSSSRLKRTLCVMAWLLIFLTGLGGGGWIHLQNMERKKAQLDARITSLERQAFILVENRRWQDATKAFDEIASIDPDSPIPRLGNRSIEAGMAEEQTQFIGYWIGQAIAELEAGRLEQAKTATQQVLDKFPDHQESTSILNRIAAAKISQERDNLLTTAQNQLNAREWEAAIKTARTILTKTPNDPDADSIITDASAALEKITKDHAKAAALLKQANSRNRGEFDQQLLDWLREANTLHPENSEIVALLEKLASYTRTLRVPEDFATPAEALAVARDRDRIILAGQVWKGPLIVNAAVDLQGSDPTKTIIECPAEDGSAITISPNALGARISSIGFRHESFDVGTTRYSVALVRGGRAVFIDCRFSESSGHGLAVIEKGHATVERCRATNNAWNGLSVMGQGSTLNAKESECRENFEHGIESWNGAAATLTNNRCEGNSRNGIHADNGDALANITGNQLIANREFGLVLGSAGSGNITGNTARNNLLGGLVIHNAAANAVVTGNLATLNQGPGLILEKGLTIQNYSTNTLTKNSDSQQLTEADFSLPDNPETRATD